MTKRLAKKVLLIGWDAADWKAIQPLMDEGKMPTLKQFVETGVMGNLATLDPPLSPIMWTSIGTGKTADKHGVLGFTQPRPDGKGIQPVMSTSRQVKAVWNILMQNGFKTHVIGWWPSHPAEPLNGVCVSDFYHKAHNMPLDQWQMAPGTVHPERLTDTLAELRVHPQELTANHILPFVPDAEQIDQETDQRLWSIAKITAECSSIHAAATWIMEHEPWDFMAVYYDSIDHYCHGFMKFHPPYREGLPRHLYDLYNGVVESGYRFHDMMLSRLLQLAGDDTTVIICSDHGFHPDHLRPLQLPREPAGPAAEHSPYGMVALCGPGIKHDELIFGSTLLDLTPTILTLFGIPIARDMDGKPLLQAFTEQVKPEIIDSWETVAGDCGQWPADKIGDPWADQEALDQLVALGYIEPPGQDAQKAVERTIRESKFYLARVYLQKNDYANALPILEELYANYPDQTRFGLRLAQCYKVLELIPEARRVTDAVIATWKQQRIEEIQKKIAQAQAAGKDTSEMKVPEDPRSPQLELLQGNLCLAEEKADEALTYFQRAQQATPRLPDLHLSIAQAYFKLKRWQDAEEAYFQALDIDPDSAAAHHGLAQVYLQMRHFKEAAEAAVTAVGLLFHNPSAHYHLGEALFRLGRFAEAEQSWLRAVAQAPGMKRAHEKLIYLYQYHLNDPVKMFTHQQIIGRIQSVPSRRQPPTTPLSQGVEAPPSTSQGVEVPPPAPPSQGGEVAPGGGSTPLLTKEGLGVVHITAKTFKATNIEVAKIITVVSGLPRSGTSMMMQMLQAGGLNLLTDEQRAADESNPKGYWEYAKVKHLSQDNTWLGEAQGKVVKIIAQLLPYLSPDYHYRIIFLQRDLEEVLQSQQTMLKQLNTKKRNPAQLRQIYTQQLIRLATWLAQQDHIALLPLDHHAVLEQPLEIAQQLHTFLACPFDMQSAITVVDQQLYRARKILCNTATAGRICLAPINNLAYLSEQRGF